jgi:hypothetical protein
MPLNNGAPDGQDSGKNGLAGTSKTSASGVALAGGKSGAINTQAIADIVYRLMQRDLIFERERAPFSEDRKCKI